MENEELKTVENTEQNKEEKKDNKFLSFLKYAKGILMKTTNGMAIGLFGTLIIGTVIALFAKIPGLGHIADWAKIIQGLMGAGIGLGVGLALKRDGITIVTLMAAGFVGNYAWEWLAFKEIISNGVSLGMGGEVGLQFTVNSIGDPLSCYISVMLAAIALKYIMVKKTPVDLILIPLVGLFIAISYSFVLAEWVHYVTIAIQFVIKASFSIHPSLSIFMCIIVSTLMGMALTAPISSVAICVAINIGSVPMAAAAALIGCCTQMVGFAVHTARDNKWGSIVAVGIGTSMLQFKNILKKPLIWVPTIAVSAVLGPIAMLFPYDKLASSTGLSVGAGMGTCGLVGPLNFFDAFNYNWLVVVIVLGIIVVSGLLVFLIDLLFRKLGWFKKGDFSLSNNL
jgi:uncharacterized membrane protein